MHRLPTVRTEGFVCLGAAPNTGRYGDAAAALGALAAQHLAHGDLEALTQLKTQRQETLRAAVLQALQQRVLVQPSQVHAPRVAHLSTDATDALLWNPTCTMCQVSVPLGDAMVQLWEGVAALGMLDDALAPLQEQLARCVVAPLLQGHRRCTVTQGRRLLFVQSSLHSANQMAAGTR